MMFCGYAIPLRALKAGEAAIAAQTHDFSITVVAKAMEPLIPPSRTAWKHATQWMAARAAADQLIFDAARAGALISKGHMHGVPYWGRKR